MQQLELFSPVRRRPSRRQPQEWRVVSCRECPTPEQQQLCETPQEAADYWRSHVAGHPYFNPDCECFVTLLLTTRRRIRGHHLVAIGLVDSVQVHPREVFRAAIIGAAHAVIVMHNHPSGDPTPSFADLRVTRDLHEAGNLLKIEVLDHIIIGNPKFASLKQLGQI
jgi:DNA repair protein RadC